MHKPVGKLRNGLIVGAARLRVGQKLRNTAEVAQPVSTNRVHQRNNVTNTKVIALPCYRVQGMARIAQHSKMVANKALGISKVQRESTQPLAMGKITGTVTE